MTKQRRRSRIPRRIAPFAIAGFAVATAVRVRRGHEATNDGNGPTDVGFMRAIHAGLRRDMDRLTAVAPEIDIRGDTSDEVRAGWEAFRDALRGHHAAEDDDLWPVLCTHLTAADDRGEVDAMVEEHRAIPGAIDAVDAALSSGVGVVAAVADLAAVLHRHLDHEERTVFPLLERHLSRREWREFLLTERGRRSIRERPRFLAWVLDDASERDEAAVMAELPPPARVVYRRVIRPRYEAQHRWRSDDVLVKTPS